MTPATYLKLKGNSDKKKFDVLNLSLLHFVQKCKRKTVPQNIPKSEVGQFDLENQPGSFDDRLKILFGIVKSNDIVYDLKEFKKKGPFLSWLYNHWAEIAKVLSDFGSLPKYAHFDIHLDDKLRSAIDNGRFDYKKN